jgi:hypothetical protein
LPDECWTLPLRRPAGEDPWTVKDAVAHVAYWKADVSRFARGQTRPPDVRRLPTRLHNRVVYERWHERSPEEVLAFYREVHADVMAALQHAPEAWFSGRERRPEWPFDLHGHSVQHRVRDIERALAQQPAKEAAPPPEE